MARIKAHASNRWIYFLTNKQPAKHDTWLVVFMLYFYAATLLTHL